MKRGLGLRSKPAGRNGATSGPKISWQNLWPTFRSLWASVGFVTPLQSPHRNILFGCLGMFGSHHFFHGVFQVQASSRPRSRGTTSSHGGEFFLQRINLAPKNVLQLWANDNLRKGFGDCTHFGPYHFYFGDWYLRYISRGNPKLQCLLTKHRHLKRILEITNAQTSVLTAAA